MAATSPNIQSKYQKIITTVLSQNAIKKKTSPQVLVDGNEAVVCGALGQDS